MNCKLFQFIKNNCKIFNLLYKILNKKSYAIGYIGKHVKVIVDRPIASKHPEYGFVYPINYGYIPGTKSPDGEEIDAYILGLEKPVRTFEGLCIAVLHRKNDNDDKLIVVPEGVNFTDREILKMTRFQEKYFDVEIIH